MEALIPAQYLLTASLREELLWQRNRNREQLVLLVLHCAIAMAITARWILQSHQHLHRLQATTRLLLRDQELRCRQHIRTAIHGRQTSGAIIMIMAWTTAAGGNWRCPSSSETVGEHLL